MLEKKFSIIEKVKIRNDISFFLIIKLYIKIHETDAKPKSNNHLKIAAIKKLILKSEIIPLW